MDASFMWIIIGATLLSVILSSINQLQNDVRRTNELLTKIAKHIGVPETSIDDEIQSLIVEGKKIKAIKIYRQATGAGLKEAKEHIDLLYEKINS
ncbi:DNA-binding protein [Clostridium zeae]|uniref:DNA-binding protein n=1 Tax=Clostridium zeae TaxID=2759022 RepID=A0ABQ1E542_9CLOT|nr:ribosomal protein L7/L12 [Clostridium zeae]GFZ29865.1 DNA-binding protein [Clostridium zeae]